jgi:hypothetical protein
LFGVFLNVLCCDSLEQVAACWFSELIWLVQEVFGNKELCNHVAIVCDEKDIVFNCSVAALDQELSTGDFMVISRVN